MAFIILALPLAAHLIIIQRTGLTGCWKTNPATCLEILVGGLTLESQITTQIGINGAISPIQINDTKLSLESSHNIVPGDRISIVMRLLAAAPTSLLVVFNAH